ncbi:alpha/beta hydrolase fold protein [Catenulispora acidiphila DSM 44928]|uniref:Alpha/beta hydrolase fold protein n=1 Tax=Catenulispora acidiphila (strain DSM 44928 / JCM 14897 / NBRC 102108 / NRRL B-24433 / ID139908) TaxID=479433 RepID=C7PX73_CATAD|nr:alpha/beta fold hydrolase [Catenulispora acidiphila]ACU69424.1 alpha/beta hydrolase fold protein [Catenulispora acidiphila DSM 44928]
MKLSKRNGVAALGLALGVAGVGLSGTASATPDAASQASAISAITWQACPQYSDDVLGAVGIQPKDRAAFRDMWARTDCGTVSVPQDYRHPEGQHVTIAFTRLKAKDQAHRQGILFMNPGGPGGSGYLMPEQVALQNPSDAQLNDQYDLIGFDPRGIGYSTSEDCAGFLNGPPPQSGQLTKAQVKQAYDASAKTNAECSSSDPAFLGQLTTANAARDLDQLRRALHESQASYFGVSWGTQLGAVYRSMFPATIHRMWLDSVVSPRAYDLAYRMDGAAQSVEQDFGLFATWLAQHDDVYGLGTTAQSVTARVLALRKQGDAHPWQFSDLSEPLDGGFIASLASSQNTDWEQAAAVLKSMTAAVSGQPAPPGVKAVANGHGPLPPPPSGAPQAFNPTAQQAYLCNEDDSSRAFEPLWDEYQRNLQRDPVTGDLTALRPTCAGWNLPVQHFTLRYSPGSLQMSGHEYETLTPYPWVWQMQQAIGGTVFTVDDFRHGSLALVPECASHLIAYFETGKADSGSCPGLQPSA